MMGETETKNMAYLDETMIETHCHICHDELPEGDLIVHSRCGVNYHESCAKRVATCPACGENLLEHFVSQQAKKKMVRNDKILSLVVFVLPFVVLLFLLGLWSLLNHPSSWSLPPLLDKALAADIFLLVVGLFLAIGIYKKYGYRPDRRALNAIVIATKGQTPGNPKEQMVSCGYGNIQAPTGIGDISIPVNKKVQRNHVVTVLVDRLIMTPEGSYNWVNPVFMKVLNPNKSPTPTTPDKLGEIWKASGRIKIMPEEEEGVGEEETVEEEEAKLCSVCQQPLIFVPQTQSWWCGTCQRYVEEGHEEQVPVEETPDESIPREVEQPPEEEPPLEEPPAEEPPGPMPPPEDEVPPPDDAPPPP